MTEKYKFKFPSNIVCPHCGKAGNVWYIDNEVYSAVCTECHQFIRKDEKSMTCLDSVDNNKDINTDNKNEYDVIIIGAGSGGIYCAKELIDKYPDLKILMLEKGSSIEKRNCPIVNNRVKNCVHCENGCFIMNGFGGAGAFSDGKYVITNEYGGNLKDYVGEDTATSLMEYVDKINIQILSDYNIPLYDSRNATFNTELAPFYAWKGQICCVKEEPFSESTFGPELAQRVGKFLEDLIPLYDYFTQFKV